MPSAVQGQPQPQLPVASGLNQIPNSNYSNANMPFNMYGMIPPSYYQGNPPAEYMDLLKKMFDFCLNEVR